MAPAEAEQQAENDREALDENKALNQQVSKLRHVKANKSVAYRKEIEALQDRVLGMQVALHERTRAAQWAKENLDRSMDQKASVQYTVAELRAAAVAAQKDLDTETERCDRARQALVDEKVLAKELEAGRGGTEVDGSEVAADFADSLIRYDTATLMKVSEDIKQFLASRDS
mmetsp:Transcript_75313/g.172476  ORF Transcript_75313/g.172476 Transcript_75313/m.172476 type:complete len:172 (+) Transcript_75313:23-538(+)